MRFMMLVKANRLSEAGALPSAELVAAMGRYNEAMVKAGVLLAAEGLHATSKGTRIKFSSGTRVVTDGPFTPAGEQLAGFWMIQVTSRQEAVDWASRIPFTEGEEVEIRQVFEATDFPAEILPPEDAAREQALRDELQPKAGKP